ncbi:hypothetical protein GCM10009654_54440 [Streptomyces hebeiensis]|uniref:Uncharacterized protein n=1 Tax=Streptomyces hebeiensis TaxID=229486 RepID=A0ABP4FM76_9ACTN
MNGPTSEPDNRHGKHRCSTSPHRSGRGRRKRTRATGTSSAAYFTVPRIGHQHEQGSTLLTEVGQGEMAILLQAPAGAGRAGDSAVLVEQCGGLPVGEAGQAGVPARSRGPSGLGTVRFGGVAAPLVGVAGFHRVPVQVSGGSSLDG